MKGLAVLRVLPNILPAAPSARRGGRRRRHSHLYAAALDVRTTLWLGRRMWRLWRLGMGRPSWGGRRA